MLWFYMVGIQQPEKEETISGIKVVFEGQEQLEEDRGLVITNQKAPTVSLIVRGNMIDLSRLKTRKDEIVVTADVTAIASAGENRVAYDVGALPVNSVSVLERIPYYITLQVENVRSKPVPVVVKNEGSIAEGYLAEEPELKPDTLQISGPEDIINSIAYAEVVWDRENAERSLSSDLDFTFRDENGKEISKDGLKTNFDFVTVTYPVKKIKEVNLLVDIAEGGGLSLNNIKYDISPSVITVAGEPETVETLNSITVGTIDLAKIISTGEIPFDIKLPNGVESVSGEKTCTVSIREITGVTTREYVTNNLSIVNLPKGLKAEIVTKELGVRLRGKEETLNLIYGYNLRAVADLQNESLSEGRYSVPVTVYLDGYNDVGVVGEYYIVIEVSPGG
jgi:YbbR domain-containing protein